MIIAFNLYRKKYFWYKIGCHYLDSTNEFRQQVWGLGILPYRYLAVLKISRKSGTARCCSPLEQHFERFRTSLVKKGASRTVRFFDGGGEGLLR